MKLARDSSVQFEMFFRQILRDENFRLPQIYFYGGAFSKLLTKSLKIHGITVGRNIFVAPKVVSIDRSISKIDGELAAHEIAHVLQYRREGFIKFFYVYLSSYWRNLKGKNIRNAAARHRAYLEIPFEIEARALAAEFVEWNERKRIREND